MVVCGRQVERGCATHSQAKLRVDQVCAAAGTPRPAVTTSLWAARVRANAMMREYLTVNS